MKTIGLLGGMSWESTVPYYQIINRLVKERLGGLHSAKCVLYSVDFAEIEACQAAGEWDRSGEILGQAAAALERAGADFIVICTNTMHKVAEQIERRLSVPLLHIADAAADALLSAGVTRPALLGTRYTMTEDFYLGRLRRRGIEALVPSAEDMELVDRVIFEELCLGVVKASSRAEYARIIASLAAHGAQGVLLGCTEIGMLIGPGDSPIPVFDTTEIHAERAVRAALEV